MIKCESNFTQRFSFDWQQSWIAICQRVTKMKWDMSVEHIILKWVNNTPFIRDIHFWRFFGFSSRDKSYASDWNQQSRNRKRWETYVGTLLLSSATCIFRLTGERLVQLSSIQWSKGGVKRLLNVLDLIDDGVESLIAGDSLRWNEKRQKSALFWRRKQHLSLDFTSSLDDMTSDHFFAFLGLINRM